MTLPSYPTERTSLISGSNRRERDPVVVEPSSSSTTTEDFSEAETVRPDGPIAKLDFKLFKSLLFDSIPGGCHLLRLASGILTVSVNSDTVLYSPEFHPDYIYHNRGTSWAR